MPTVPVPRAVPVPPASRIRAAYATTHLADAFSIELPPHATHDTLVLARFVIEGEKPGAGGSVDAGRI